MLALSSPVLLAGHLLLTRAASVGAAQRIVSAYLAHSDSLVTDTELRHLGCLAAFLFAVMGADHEEEAFFTLLALVEDRLPATCTLQVGLLSCVCVCVRARAQTHCATSTLALTLAAQEGSSAVKLSHACCATRTTISTCCLADRT